MDWLYIIIFYFFYSSIVHPCPSMTFPFSLLLYIFFSALSYSSQGVQVLNLSVEMTIEIYNFEHSLLEMHFFFVTVTKR